MSEKCCAATHAESATARGSVRPRWIYWLSALSLVGLALLIASSGETKLRGSPVRRAAAAKPWNILLARLPLSFEVNRGQTDSCVKFLARGPGYTVFLTSRGAVLAFDPRTSNQGRFQALSLSEVALRVRWLGASSAGQVSGERPLPGYSNYFIGNDPARWRTRIPHYARVRYHQVYPGVDLVYYGRGGQLENDFVVAAGADAQRIRLGLEGVEGVRVDGAGDLRLKVEGGEVWLRRPRAYQGEGQGRREVEARYVLGAGDEVGFALGRYDRRRALVIDPVLAYATYLGGNGGDIGYAIAVDSSGDAYVAGITNSSNFPVTTGVLQPGSHGNGDAFVAKLNSTGSKLVYSTYIGGSGADSAAAIAVNSGGDAFITGSTSSSDFPATTGAFQTAYKGSGDAFVTQLDSAGDKLVYSSYLGGTGADFGLGIAIDSSNNAYVTGSTQSVDFSTVSPLQATNAGSSDAFVAKVNFDGSQLLYSTYLGGTQADVGESIQVDSSGNAYVAGYTFSANFPVQNPLQGMNAGTVNAFVTKLNSAGSALAFSTYLGGNSDDRAFGLALDKSGDIYVTGSSQSSNFPTTVGAFQITNHGHNAFVSKLNPSGPTLVYSTLLGGTGVDQGNGIAVDSSGNAFLTGFTQSSDFPTQSPIQSILGITAGSLCGTSVCADAFVTQVNPTGTGLVYSTYLGGSGADYGQAIALDSTDDPYVAGGTASTNFPAIAGAYQSSLAGVAGNAFVAKIDSASAAGIALVPGVINFGNQTESVRSAPQTITVVDEGTAPLTITQITSSKSDFAETDNCVGTVAAAGGFCTINVTFTPSSLTTETATLSITDNASGSPQTISLSGTGVKAETQVTVTPASLSFGNVTVGNVSTAQAVTITNTGTQTLTISAITTTGDFSQTNTCGLTLNLLNVGQSCTINVTFTPTASGARSGSLSINDNATGSPQSVALSGTGVAVFSMSSPSPTATVVIGDTTATFTVAASAPSSFSGSITLGCSAGTTCSFSPATIFAGQTSTLTVSSLTTSLSNPYNFTVTGVSGSQSATVNLTLLFADYNLSHTPALDTIVPGAPASYTITVTPTNGFSKSVQLSCSSGAPPGSSCSFSPASVTPNGSPVNSTLTIATTKTSTFPPPPTVPPGAIPPLAVGLFLLVVSLLGFALSRNASLGLAGPRWRRVGVCALGLIILSDLFLGACRPSTTTASGTPTGSYIVTISGTLNSNTAVVRTTKVDLEITPKP